MKTIIITHLDKTSEDNQISINQLDEITNASIDDIRLGNTLDYVSNRNDALRDVLSKLRYGGSIEILGVDIYDVGRGLAFCGLDLQEANKLLYEGKQSVDTLQNVTATLQSLELEILIKRIHKYVYFIKAKRPEPKLNAV